LIYRGIQKVHIVIQEKPFRAAGKALLNAGTDHIEKRFNSFTTFHKQKWDLHQDFPMKRHRAF